MSKLMVSPKRSDRLRELIRRRGAKRRWEAVITLSVIACAVIIPLVMTPRIVRWLKDRSHASSAGNSDTSSLVVFPDTAGGPIKIPQDHWSDLGLTTVAIQPGSPPPPLKMDGVLYLDPDDYVLVRSRFQGEVVATPNSSSVPSTHQDPSNHPHGPVQVSTLKFGDRVRKGDLLCVIWSRELGEKKSEMAQIQAQLEFDRETLERMRPAQSAIPQKEVREVERRIRDGEISLQRIENTLRSWQLSDSEIGQIRRQITPTSSPSTAPPSVDQWARVEVRAPIDGTIVEKDITEGMLVGIDDTLYKIANLSHLDVRAFAYEEDLVAIQQLDTSLWHWTIHLKGDKSASAIQGRIDRIGALIDPIQHTGLVMGWVDNPNGAFRPGQFVSARVQLPEKTATFCIPSEAVVDLEGKIFILVQGALPEFFYPMQVNIDRFQDGCAYLIPPTSSAETNPQGEPILKIGATVIVNGALELLAEYRSAMQLSSKETVEAGAGQALRSTSSEMSPSKPKLQSNNDGVSQQ